MGFNNHILSLIIYLYPTQRYVDKSVFMTKFQVIIHTGIYLPTLYSVFLYLTEFSKADLDSLNMVRCFIAPKFLMCVKLSPNI